MSIVINLVLGRTQCDPTIAWTETRIVPVELPIDNQDGWQVIGADWAQEEADA